MRRGYTLRKGGKFSLENSLLLLMESDEVLRWTAPRYVTFQHMQPLRWMVLQLLV